MDRPKCRVVGAARVDRISENGLGLAEDCFERLAALRVALPGRHLLVPAEVIEQLGH